MSDQVSIVVAAGAVKPTGVRWSIFLLTQTS
jgi:hypothetical protein